jgi:hypothetical protein
VAFIYSESWDQLKFHGRSWIVSCYECCILYCSVVLVQSPVWALDSVWQILRVGSECSQSPLGLRPNGALPPQGAQDKTASTCFYKTRTLPSWKAWSRDEYLYRS